MSLDIEHLTHYAPLAPASHRQAFNRVYVSKEYPLQLLLKEEVIHQVCDTQLKTNPVDVFQSVNSRFNSLMMILPFYPLLLCPLLLLHLLRSDHRLYGIREEDEQASISRKTINPIDADDGQWAVEAIIGERAYIGCLFIF